MTKVAVEIEGVVKSVMCNWGDNPFPWVGGQNQ